MTLRWNGSEGPASRALKLAEEAKGLAKEGRREESRRIFERAFEQVRAHGGTFGTRKNAVGERSKLALVIADMAYDAGHEAGFAMRMWEHGTKMEALRKGERGDTHMFYPVELMFLAKKEKEGAAEDVPPVSVQCAAEEGRKGILSGLFEKIRKIFARD